VSALPTVSASASPSATTQSATLPVPVTALPSSQVQEALSDIPIADLNETQLSELLSKLPSLSTLPAGQLQPALSELLKDLAGEGATLGQLTGALGSVEPK
jgi:hypothetical protein